MSTRNLANMLYLQYIKKTIQFSLACNRTLFCFPILVGTDCLQTVSICALLLLRYPNPFHIIDGDDDQQFPQLWGLSQVHAQQFTIKCGCENKPGVE